MTKTPSHTAPCTMQAFSPNHFLKRPRLGKTEQGSGALGNWLVCVVRITLHVVLHNGRHRRLLHFEFLDCSVRAALLASTSLRIRRPPGRRAMRRTCSSCSRVRSDSVRMTVPMDLCRLIVSPAACIRSPEEHDPAYSHEETVLGQVRHNFN